MECKDFKTLLIPILKESEASIKEYTPEAAQQFSDFLTHLAECESCRRLHDFVLTILSFQKGMFKGFLQYDEAAIGYNEEEHRKMEMLNMLGHDKIEHEKSNIFHMEYGKKDDEEPLDKEESESRFKILSHEEYILIYDMVMQQIRSSIQKVIDKESEDFTHLRSLVGALFELTQCKEDLISGDINLALIFHYVFKGNEEMSGEVAKRESLERAKFLRMAPSFESFLGDIRPDEEFSKQYFTDEFSEREDFAPLYQLIDNLEIENVKEKMFILNAYALYLTLQDQRKRMVHLV